MAYNFRPKNRNEILSQRKGNSEIAANIYDFIMKEYGVTIVLDPTTNFNKIKIPREVKDKDTLANIKNKMIRNKIFLGSVVLDFGNGSGAGGSSMNAAETAKQENGTRLYCEYFNERNIFPPAAALQKVYPEADDDWVNTFELQAKEMKRYLHAAGYEWSRDSGIMPFVENIAKNSCGVKKKDSWNPADIYCVRKSRINDIQNKMNEIAATPQDPRNRLMMLNDYMRELFISKDLIGISLKKLSKGQIKIEETNVGNKNVKHDVGIVKNTISLNLNMKASGEFETGELTFKIDVGGHLAVVQVRSFSGGVRETSQMEMTGVGAAAKLGKVSTIEAIDPYLSRYGLKRRKGNEVPKVGSWTQHDIDHYVEEFNSIKNVRLDGSLIDWGGVNDFRPILSNAIAVEKENNRTAMQLCAKLQCFQWIKNFDTLQQRGKLEEFLVVLYNGAKKQYDSAGPFLKIS